MLRTLIISILLNFTALGAPDAVGALRPMTDEEWDRFHNEIFPQTDREAFYRDTMELLQEIDLNKPADNDNYNFLWVLSYAPYRGTGRADAHAPRYGEWDKKLLEYLVGERKLDLNQERPDSRGKDTPIFESIRNCNLVLAKEFVRLGADYKKSYQTSMFRFKSNVLTHAVSCAPRTLKFVQYFLGELKAFEVNSIDFCSGMSQASRHFETWDYYVSLGGDPEHCRRILGLSN